MASVDHFCDICQLRHTSSPAIVWCSECEEAICSDCTEHHSLAKMTRNHKTISISDYLNLPSSVLDIKHYCEIHDERFEFYCPNHSAVSCVKCIEVVHNSCSDIKSLRDVVKCVKASAGVVELENRLHEIRNFYDKIKTEKTGNSRYIEQNAAAYKDTVLHMRRDIDKHLDKLEQEILSSIQEKRFECESKISKIQDMIATKHTLIESLIEKVVKLKEHASELQTFLGIKEIERDLQVEFAYVQSLEEKPDFDNIELELKTSSIVKSILSLVSYGSIEVETNKSSVSLITSANRQSQMLQPNQGEIVRNIDNVVLTKKTDFVINQRNKNMQISGCEILPDNKLLLVSHNNKELLVYTDTGTFLDKFDMTWKPIDVTYLGNNTIAVSFGCDERICTYNMESKKIQYETKTSHEAWGLSFNDNKIFCRVSTIGVQVFSLKCVLISSIKFESTSTTYISATSDHIYYTVTNVKKISCCDMEGNTVWEITDKTLISDPRDITSYRNGVAFVADSITNRILLISANGKKVRSVLDRNDGMNQPRCVHLHDNKTLLVCNYTDGYIFLYDVTQP